MLSDARLRAVYDRGGRRGLEDDKAIISRTVFPVELMEEYEKLKNLWEERTYIQDTNPQGLFEMNVDATPLTMGFRDPWSILSLKSIASEQSVDATLTDTTEANIMGRVMTAVGEDPVGGIQFAVRQDLGSTNWVQGIVTAGTLPTLGVDFYRKLSDRMYLISENRIILTQYGLLPSLNAQLSLRLSNQSMAHLRISDTGEQVGLSVTHQVNPKLALNGDVKVGHLSSSVRLGSLYEPWEGCGLRGGVGLSTNGPLLYYGAHNQIAKLTHFGAMVTLSTSKGVSVKLRLSRATMCHCSCSAVCNIPSPAAVWLHPRDGNGTTSASTTPTRDGQEDGGEREGDEGAT